jgi:FixJ family two-component response regulator
MKLANLFHDKATREAVAEQERDAEERLGRLTHRQRELLPLLVSGSLNKQVAFALGVSPRTIENHRLEIMARTDCKSFAELIKIHTLAG